MLVLGCRDPADPLPAQGNLGRGASASQGPALAPAFPLQCWMDGVKAGFGVPLGHEWVSAAGAGTWCWGGWGAARPWCELGLGNAGSCSLLEKSRSQPAAGGADGTNRSSRWSWEWAGVGNLCSVHLRSQGRSGVGTSGSPPAPLPWLWGGCVRGSGPSLRIGQLLPFVRWKETPCQPLASPKPQCDQPCGSSSPRLPTQGRGTRSCWGRVCPPQLLPQTSASVQPRRCSMHTQSLLFPPAQHLVTPRSRVCSHTRRSHTHHTRRVHPSRCYLLTSFWCTPTLAPVAVSHPVHTHPRCTLPLLSHTRHTLGPGAHSLLLLPYPWCTLTSAAVSHTVRTQSRGTLASPAISHVVRTHPGARRLQLPSRTRCTLAQGARSPPHARSPLAPGLPHAPSLALFTPSPGPRPAWGAAGAPRSHLTMPYMTRTLPSSPTTHTTE